MLNLMVANAQPGGDRGKRLVRMLNAQVENSLELGWRREDVVVLSNFQYEHAGVVATQAPLNEFCLTGSKMFGVKHMLDNAVGDVLWAHDLDAWQNAPFAEPEFRDVGIAQYSNSKYNGGSVFWRESARDIVDAICRELSEKRLQREEPTLNGVLRSKAFRDRVTVLNNTFNVGCSGYVVRAARSDKPLRVCHFHPDNRIAWETHALDRNETGEVGITVRLERLIRRHWPDLARTVVTKVKPKHTTGGRDEKAIGN